MKVRLAAFLLGSGVLWAQGSGVVLTGTVRGPSSMPIGGAEVSIKSVMTGQVTEVQTNSAGVYDAPNLFAGEYQVSVSAEGYSSKQVAVTIATGPRQTLDVSLVAGIGNAGGPQAPTLGELGFPQGAQQGNPQEQARLDRRSHMLQMHQRLGLITGAFLVATFVASAGAGGRSTSSATRAAVEEALRLGITDAAAVLHILRMADPEQRRQHALALAAELAQFERPMPVMDDYDLLLAGAPGGIQ